MKRVQDDKVDQTENLYRELVGTDDASLLKEMAEAEWQWEEEKRKHPEEAAKLEQEAEFDFELLMNRINVEGKKNISKRKYNHRTKWENQDVIREYKKFKRAAVIAAVLGVLLVGGGIDLVAFLEISHSGHEQWGHDNSGGSARWDLDFLPCVSIP